MHLVAYLKLNIETEHVQKIQSVIPSSLDLMSKLFEKNDEQLSITLSWCFSKISEFHSILLVQNKDIFSFFVTVILNLLKQQNLSNKIKRHFCQALYSLASYISNNNIQSWNLFSPFLQYLRSFGLFTYFICCRF